MAFISQTSVSLQALVVLVTVTALYKFYTRLALYRQRRAFKLANGCLPPAVSRPFKDPIIAIDFMLGLYKAAKQKRFFQFFDNLFDEHGSTFVATSLRGQTVWTCESENIKAVLATRFDDWEIGRTRSGVKPLLGEGIFTSDGERWAHSRAMIRPNFAKDQVADLDKFEESIQALLQNIPAGGETIDLQDLFHRYSMDVSTQFLLGQSTNSLAPGQSEVDARLARGFDIALEDALMRARTSILYYVLPHKDAKSAIKDVRQAIAVFVNEALDKTRATTGTERANDEKGNYVFLHQLAEQTNDPKRINDEALSVLLAGRDTTASLLSSLWFELARHPEVWTRLQAEVDELHGDLPTYDRLRDMKYLKHCASEALRLVPPVPLLPKVAIKDTVLPRGGGPDGNSPLFVPKGSGIAYIFRTMHRRKEIYGDDASSFKPDRWADPSFRPGWNYLPFGGGPRVCLGQQFALTECYYVTIRLMQHFRRVENRDPNPWQDKLTLTLSSFNGTKVGLFPS